MYYRRLWQAIGPRSLSSNENALRGNGATNTILGFERKRPAMIALLWLVLAILASPFKSKWRLEAENAALRHQVIVLWRQARGRIRLTNLDRLFLVQLYRWFPSILRQSRSNKRP
jgi:hypothetical protein